MNSPKATPTPLFLLTRKIDRKPTVDHCLIIRCPPFTSTSKTVPPKRSDCAFVPCWNQNLPSAPIPGDSASPNLPPQAKVELRRKLHPRLTVDQHHWPRPDRVRRKVRISFLRQCHAARQNFTNEIGNRRLSILTTANDTKFDSVYRHRRKQCAC